MKIRLPALKAGSLGFSFRPRRHGSTANCSKVTRMRGFIVSAVFALLLASCAAAGGPSNDALHAPNGTESFPSPSAHLLESPTPAGHLYVLAYETAQPGLPASPTPTPAIVAVYSVNDTGNHAPRRLIGGPSNVLWVGSERIAADRYGDLYVTCFRCVNGFNGPTGGLLQFAPKANGNASPSATEQMTMPYGVGVDAHGNPYVYDPGTGVYPVLDEFPIGPGGGSFRQITGSNTGFTGASDLVRLDHAGHVYVAEPGQSRFQKFAASANGNIAPISSFTDARFGSTVTIYDLTIDRANNVYTIASVNGTPEVDEYPSGSSGLITPTVVLSGALTQMYQSVSIAFDNAGRLYIGNCASSCPSGFPNVTVYAAGASGDVAPVSVLDILNGATGIGSISIGK
jgi:hypothetical protein